MEKIEILNAGEIIDRKTYEGWVEGIPTGMYADRSSYGNAPLLAIVLDNRLPCKFRARPYSHRTQIRTESSELEEPLKLLFRWDSDDENENLGIAASFVDQSIKEKTTIRIQGYYKEGIFLGSFLKIENIGFEFPGYLFPYETRDEN